MFLLLTHYRGSLRSLSKNIERNQMQEEMYISSTAKHLISFSIIHTVLCTTKS